MMNVELKFMNESSFKHIHIYNILKIISPFIFLNLGTLFIVALSMMY